MRFQACQTSADPRNSAFFDFPEVIFVNRPDPRRFFLKAGGGGGGGGGQARSYSLVGKMYIVKQKTRGSLQ